VTGRSMERGKKDDAGRQWPLPIRAMFTTGRMVGFMVLAVPAIVIFAVVVLIPQSARLQSAVYERNLERADKADLAALRDAYGRLNLALLEDETLVKRVAMSELNLQPKDEYVCFNPDVAANPVGTITMRPAPRPATPGGWITVLANRLEDPAKRRGLLLLAAGALLAALFVFSAPEKYRGKKPANPA